MSLFHCEGSLASNNHVTQEASAVTGGTLGVVVSCYVLVEERDRLELFEYTYVRSPRKKN